MTGISEDDGVWQPLRWLAQCLHFRMFANVSSALGRSMSGVRVLVEQNRITLKTSPAERHSHRWASVPGPVRRFSSV